MSKIKYIVCDENGCEWEAASSFELAKEAAIAKAEEAGDETITVFEVSREWEVVTSFDLKEVE